MTDAQDRRAAFLIAVLVAVPALAAYVGPAQSRSVLLNLGPGDGPFIKGFAPKYEIEERVARQWTTYDALVSLPLVLEGGAELSYRYARVFSETAQVDVAFSGRPLERFSRRGGVYETRRLPVSGSGRPISVSFKIESHDQRRLGLRMDWLRLDPWPGTRIRLAGVARWRGALLVAVCALLLWLSGLSLATAALLVTPVCAALVVGLLYDPWLAHRLLLGIPELLLVAGAAGIALGRLAVARGALAPAGLRTLVALCCAAFLLRAVAVNHPDFYYPDQQTHGRLVEYVALGGLDFFVHPSQYIARHGVWLTQAYDRTYAFPYSPAFHLPFVPLGLDYDALLRAMKLVAAAVSVVPIVLLWFLARRLDASVLGCGLMLLIPTYTSRLSFAFFPALFGHVFDLGLILWLSRFMPRLGESRRVFATGVALVCACQLAYVSGVINTAVLLGTLAVFVALEPPRSLRRGGLVLAMGLLASLVSVALYYRDFLELLADVAVRATDGTAGALASHHPAQPFVSVVIGRTADFFGGVYPCLALVGVSLLVGEGRARSLLLAWSASYFVLLLGRAKVPDVFLHGHETLLVTPLVCLGSGEALAFLWRLSRFGRLATAILLLFLAFQGLLGQWQAVAAQLANAR